jgi:cell division septal protein FtsQ
MWKRHATFRSPKSASRVFKKRMIASGMGALAMLTLAVGVWYGARRPEVTIASVSVSGGSTVPHEQVEEKVIAALSGNYALLIPKRFSFLYPKEAITDAVNTLPRVHNAAVARESLTQLSVTFEEYTPYALWCDSAATSTAAESCLFIDSEGFAYAEAPPLRGETLIRFVVDGRLPERGVHVYDRETLQKYHLLVEAIEARHEHHLRAMTETKDGDVLLHLNQGVDLWITRDANIEEVFENLESILQAPEFVDRPLESFEYIDLRFGNKVYVKERGKELPPDEASLDEVSETGESVPQ